MAGGVSRLSPRFAWLPRFTLLGRIGCLSPLGAGSIPDTEACRNPLFQTHWFSRGGSVETLNDALAVHTNLRLCPAYNGIPSCCQESFEPEQSQHFNYWKQILTAKLERIRKNRAGTLAVRRHEAYNAASDQDRELHQRAVRTYEEVLDPARHGGCFSALLTYVAGMVCFSCEADWQKEVKVHMGELVGVRLTDSTCSELWGRCKAFGELTSRLRQAVLDSSLASAQSTPLEDVSMLADRQSLCDWAHDSIALRPFVTPSEAQREAAPPALALGRRLASDAPGYDAMRAGRASGFALAWPGASAHGNAAAVRPGARLLAIALATAALRGAR